MICKRLCKSFSNVVSNNLSVCVCVYAVWTHPQHQHQHRDDCISLALVGAACVAIVHKFWDHAERRASVVQIERADCDIVIIFRRGFPRVNTPYNAIYQTHRILNVNHFSFPPRIYMRLHTRYLVVPSPASTAYSFVRLLFIFSTTDRYWSPVRNDNITVLFFFIHFIEAHYHYRGFRCIVKLAKEAWVKPCKSQTFEAGFGRNNSTRSMRITCVKLNIYYYILPVVDGRIFSSSSSRRLYGCVCIMRDVPVQRCMYIVTST